jgi:hypothetical protein
MNREVDFCSNTSPLSPPSAPIKIHSFFTPKYLPSHPPSTSEFRSPPYLASSIALSSRRFFYALSRQNSPKFRLAPAPVIVSLSCFDGFLKPPFSRPTSIALSKDLYYQFMRNAIHLLNSLWIPLFPLPFDSKNAVFFKSLGFQLSLVFFGSLTYSLVKRFSQTPSLLN